MSSVFQVSKDGCVCDKYEKMGGETSSCFLFLPRMRIWMHVIRISSIDGYRVSLSCLGGVEAVEKRLYTLDRPREIR